MQAIRGHTEDRVASVAKTSLSIDEYRSRLVAIYSMHNPSNVEKVDYLLSKYKEKENLLYDSVCAKYHIPEGPGVPQRRLAGRPRLSEGRGGT